jgi:hypothetical protein
MDGVQREDSDGWGSRPSALLRSCIIGSISHADGEQGRENSPDFALRRTSPVIYSGSMLIERAGRNPQ